MLDDLAMKRLATGVIHRAIKDLYSDASYIRESAERFLQSDNLWFNILNLDAQAVRRALPRLLKDAERFRLNRHRHERASAVETSLQHRQLAELSP